MVPYDVSTLYFETDAGDGFRERGFSKERRLERQITIGLLTDEFGFPLMAERSRAIGRDSTMLATITSVMAAHKLPDVTIMADAGMISDANKKAIETAGLSFILGMRTPEIYPFPLPYATHSR
jgi:transposase